METTLCLECGAIADVQWRAVLESTDGPVEHAYGSDETGSKYQGQEEPTASRYYLNFDKG